MSGISGAARIVLRRSARPVGEFSISLTACLVVLTYVATVLIRAPASTQSLALPVVVLGAGALFGLGLTDIAHGRELPFARALIAAGVLWSLSALMASDEPFAYSLGRVSQWGAELAIVYLLLSYPSGRLTAGADRALFAGGALVIGLLYLPTTLVAQFPHLSLWSMCSTDCPRNAFSLVPSTPAFVRDVVMPLREVLTVALFTAVAVAATLRARKAESPLGRLHAPIVAFAILQAVASALYFPLREVAPYSGALSVLAWIFVLSFPSVGLACATGRPYQRIHTANVLERLARNLSASASAADVRFALADALTDPSLQILHSFPGDLDAWVDESGAAVELAAAAAGRRATQVASGNWRIAILQEASLAPAASPSQGLALVLSAGSYALAALENQCLIDELQRALRNLSESRASRLTAERDTRRKIERDLHDGAQQRLVALRLKLGMAAARLAGRDPEGAELVRALEADVDATIAEVRSLAGGIYPPLLARTGLVDALREAARAAALPTTVLADERLGRYPTEIETTVYFACSEAMQNAAKHAGAASRVTISLWEDDALSFEIRDDGAGFDLPTTPYGIGLSNLSDRLGAVGGTVTIWSAPGQGTVLRGSIPLPPADVRDRSFNSTVVAPAG